MSKPAEPVEQRFHRMYVKRGPSECWEWIMSRSTNGYGRILIDGKSRIASRVAYELAYGKMDPDLCVLHSCDNRACVNPNHLRLGTIADNSKDMYDRFRFPKQVMTSEMKCVAEEMLLSGKSQKEVAASLSVHKGCIHNISRRVIGILPVRGYSWHKRDRRFAVAIRVNGERIHVGNFMTEREAHEAYESARNNSGQTAGAGHPSAIVSPGAQ